ncbi:hypothetical protein KM043_008748 [Ampulex compressa]|nr:hypothetical protein KM043_008748 [Ampulex compressa]
MYQYGPSRRSENHAPCQPGAADAAPPVPPASALLRRANFADRQYFPKLMFDAGSTYWHRLDLKFIGRKFFGEPGLPRERSGRTAEKILFVLPAPSCVEFSNLPN